ncbi:hypothetical protein C8J57DRAFT_1718233 [Mycena rebaudengoi]|nr:hypothetical protein C8J57DRAFT_1718233 [Mycena rebaudengoi]
MARIRTPPPYPLDNPRTSAADALPPRLLRRTLPLPLLLLLFRAFPPLLRHLVPPSPPRLSRCAPTHIILWAKELRVGEVPSARQTWGDRWGDTGEGLRGEGDEGGVEIATC